MIEGIAHICISAVDLAETERFYCSGLGFHKAFDFIRGDDVFGFYLEVANRTFIEVFRQEGEPGTGAMPIRHICFEVSDIDSIIEHLQAQKYEVTEKRLGADQSWQAWVTDPSGVRIELHEYTDKSSQITRENCKVE